MEPGNSKHLIGPTGFILPHGTHRRPAAPQSAMFQYYLGLFRVELEITTRPYLDYFRPMVPFVFLDMSANEWPKYLGR